MDDRAAMDDGVDEDPLETFLQVTKCQVYWVGASLPSPRLEHRDLLDRLAGFCWGPS